MANAASTPAGETSKTFHAPNCKLVTKKMVRRARTVARMQSIQAAPECVMTDAEAAKQWQEELKKPVSTITRAGGYSVGTGTPQSHKSPTRTSPAKPATDTESPFTPAERLARVQCAREWPDDYRMRKYCEDRAPK